MPTINAPSDLARESTTMSTIPIGVFSRSAARAHAASAAFHAWLKDQAGVP